MYNFLAEAAARSMIRELDVEGARPESLMSHEMKLARPARRRRRWRNR